MRRSFWGFLSTIGCAVAAVALPGAMVWQGPQPGPKPAELNPWLLPAITGYCLFSAVWSEQIVRRQLALARRGLIADATIQTVRRYPFIKKRVATWWFTAADGRTYEGWCTLNEIEVLVLRSGSQVSVFYEADNPKFNRLDSKLWAVAWDEESE